MSADDRYTMLMASLPHLTLPRSGGTELPFVCDRTPINRIRLEQRLGWMEDDDRALVERIERVLAWELLPLATTDGELVGSITALLDDLRDAGETVLLDLVQVRFELRTLVAGLRHRHAGHPAPAPTEVWGDRETCARIARSWSVSGFGLGAVHPWVRDAERLLHAGDPVGFERLLIEAGWKQLEERGFGHHFDLVAVCVWLLKWDLLDRAVRHDPRVADRRFHGLLDAARADHRPDFAQAAGTRAQGKPETIHDDD